MIFRFRFALRSSLERETSREVHDLLPNSCQKVLLRILILLYLPIDRRSIQPRRLLWSGIASCHPTSRKDFHNHNNYELLLVIMRIKISILSECALVRPKYPSKKLWLNGDSLEILSRVGYSCRVVLRNELLYPRKMIRVQLFFLQYLVHQDVRNIQLARNPTSARPWVVQRMLDDFFLHCRSSYTTRTSTATSRHKIARFSHPPNRRTNDIRVRMSTIREELHFFHLKKKKPYHLEIFVNFVPCHGGLTRSDNATRMKEQKKSIRKKKTCHLFFHSYLYVISLCNFPKTWSARVPQPFKESAASAEKLQRNRPDSAQLTVPRNEDRYNKF